MPLRNEYHASRLPFYKVSALWETGHISDVLGRGIQNLPFQLLYEVGAGPTGQRFVCVFKKTKGQNCLKSAEGRTMDVLSPTWTAKLVFFFSVLLISPPYKHT